MAKQPHGPAPGKPGSPKPGPKPGPKGPPR